MWNEARSAGRLGAVGPVIAAAVAVILAAGSSAAQRPGQQGQQQPSRDTPVQQRVVVGTASISGSVVAADSGRPIRRARVLATSPAAGSPRSALTDRDGRYELTGLPAGLYQLSAMKNGYMTTVFGQRRVQQRSGRPVTLADGQKVERIDFGLPRGGVISGHVFDEDGEPLLGAMVTVFRSTWGPSGRQNTNAGTGVSDDRGYYRVFGLVPGNYYVAANARNADLGGGRGMGPGGPGGGMPARLASDIQTEGEDAALGFASTYYPGVSSSSEATPITVAIQQETPDVNFTLRLVPTARVMGLVASPDGTGVQGVVTLTSEDTGGAEIGMGLSGTILPDGSFVINNVPPGRYIATARTRAGGGRMGGPGGAPGATGSQLFATQPVSVSGRDVSVSMTLARGTTISGTITFESMGGSAAEPSRVSVTLTPATGRGGGPGGFGGGGTFRASTDNTFTITDVAAGTYMVRVGGASGTWGLKSVTLGGRDTADTPVEIKGTQPITGMSVVLTDQPTTVSGTVADSTGQPVTNGIVVAYPLDSSLWRGGTRLLQVARPDQDGNYRIRAMPPGDYYLVAVIDLDDNEWYDPAILEALRQVATRVTLSEGETETRTLRPMTVGR